MGMFSGIILALVIGGLIESGNSYYTNLGENIKIVSLLFLPQVGLSYFLVQFAIKAVKNYNMIALPKQMISQCSYKPNPCCTPCK